MRLSNVNLKVQYWRSCPEFLEDQVEQMDGNTLHQGSVFLGAVSSPSIVCLMNVRFIQFSLKMVIFTKNENYMETRYL